MCWHIQAICVLDEGMRSMDVVILQVNHTACCAHNSWKYVKLFLYPINTFRDSGGKYRHILNPLNALQSSLTFCRSFVQILGPEACWPDCSTSMDSQSKCTQQLRVSFMSVRSYLSGRLATDRFSRNFLLGIFTDVCRYIRILVKMKKTNTLF